MSVSIKRGGCCKNGTTALNEKKKHCGFTMISFPSALILIEN